MSYGCGGGCAVADLGGLSGSMGELMVELPDSSEKYNESSALGYAGAIQRSKTASPSLLW